MSYRVITAVFESGERFPVLLYAENGQPVVLPTRFVVNELRGRRQSNTIAKAVRTIGWFYTWADSVGISLESRLRLGPPLTAAEITGCARYLRSGRNEKVVGGINGSGGLRAATFNYSLSYIMHFVLWVVREYYHNYSTGAEVERNFERAQRLVEQAFLSHRLLAGPPQKRYGLGEKEVRDLFTIIHPSSPQNPFNRPVRFRNYLLIRLLFETGIRRGEAAKLYVSDVSTQGAEPFVKVVRRPDDPQDTRRHEPAVKTLERIIPISRSLCQDAITYLQKHRGSARHPFLLVSYRGAIPLDVDQINEIFARVRRVFPQFGNLSPHDTRRTFNDHFLKTAHEQGISGEKLHDLQNYLNGWTEGSQQGAVYARKYIEAKARELVSEMQSKLYPKV